MLNQIYQLKTQTAGVLVIKNNRMTENFDVVIIGGGPAGAAAAITLGRYTKLKVAIIEKAEFDDYRAGESVSPSIFTMLAYLGIERPQLENVHLPSYAHAAAWGSTELIVRDLLFTGQGNGLHLDRQKFDTLLLTEATNRGVIVYQPASLVEINHDGDWQIEIITNGNELLLNSRYLIDCSGKIAVIVKMKQCRVHKEDSLIGLYAYYNVPDGLVLEQKTVLETTLNGWYYMTPLPGKKVAIAFITDADILKGLDLNNPDSWLSHGMGTLHIAQTLRHLNTPLAFKHYAIHSRVALLPVKDNWTAAGDAATCYDPISSMGIGNAISSGITSARVAEGFFNGNFEVAQSYSRSLLDHFETYLKMRHGFYTAENRWPDSLFWQRRSKNPLER